MEEKHLSDAAASVNADLRELYQSAFPTQEQVPWGELIPLIGEMPLDLTAYYDAGQFVGFTIVYAYEKWNWLWYFAVSPEKRGRGYGSQILEHTINAYGSRPLILDMESPDQPAANHAQRLRRLNFYRRHGFRDSRARRSYGGVEYTIMINGEQEFTDQDYTDIINNLRRFWQ